MGLNIDKWSLDSQVAYLNHGSFGAVPKVVAGAQHEIQALEPCIICDSVDHEIKNIIKPRGESRRANTVNRS